MPGGMWMFTMCSPSPKVVRVRSWGAFSISVHSSQLMDLKPVVLGEITVMPRTTPLPEEVMSADLPAKLLRWNHRQVRPSVASATYAPGWMSVPTAKVPWPMVSAGSGWVSVRGCQVPHPWLWKPVSVGRMVMVWRPLET